MLMPYRGRHGPGGLEGAVRYEGSGGIAGVGSVCFQAFKSAIFSSGYLTGPNWRCKKERIRVF